MCCKKKNGREPENNYINSLFVSLLLRSLSESEPILRLNFTFPCYGKDLPASASFPVIQLASTSAFRTTERIYLLLHLFLHYNPPRLHLSLL
jgi:hypothetical protein